MAFMNKGMQRRNQRIAVYVIVFLVIISFLLTIILPLWM